VRDVVVFGVVIVAFASAATFHLALAIGLARRVPRVRGLVAFFIPPLAPYWGFAEHMPVRSIGWIASVAVYVVARFVR
jgi:hypothetical protein